MNQPVRRFGLRNIAEGASLDRLGGVRKEERERKPIPARDEPMEEKVPVQTTPRGTTLDSGVRPSNEFTVEEMRIHALAVAGPLRVWAAGRRWIVTLESGKSNLLITKGKNCPVYVRVTAALDSQGPRRLNFTEGGPGTEMTARSIVLPDEDAFLAIVLPGEALYVSTLDDFPTVGPGTTFKLKVQEVSL